MVCSPDALTGTEKYHLPPVPRSSDPLIQDMLFRKWVADALTLYPELLNSYDLLLNCWNEYSEQR